MKSHDKSVDETHSYSGHYKCLVLRSTYKKVNTCLYYSVKLSKLREEATAAARSPFTNEQREGHDFAWVTQPTGVTAKAWDESIFQFLSNRKDSEFTGQSYTPWIRIWRSNSSLKMSTTL